MGEKNNNAEYNQQNYTKLEKVINKETYSDAEFKRIEITC